MSDKMNIHVHIPRYAMLLLDECVRVFTTNSVYSTYVPIHLCVHTRNTRVFTQQAMHAWRRWRYDANVLSVIRYYAFAR